MITAWPSAELFTKRGGAPRRFVMKTPALDFLSKNKAVFKLYEYQSSDNHDFGKHAAAALGLPEAQVCKTIILHCDKTYVTCIVPVSGRISLKAAARAAKLKHLETVDPATATRVTGGNWESGT